MIKLNGKRKHSKMNHKKVKIFESYSSKKRTLSIFKKKEIVLIQNENYYN